MNKFFLIFLSASISRLLSGMESVPTKPEPQTIVQDLLANKVAGFTLNPVQKYWIRLFFNNQSPLCVSEFQDARALVLSNAEKKCLIASCPKGATFLKVYGNKQSFIENRCVCDCSECDEIVKALEPNPLKRAFESILFPREQSEFLPSHLLNGSRNISERARIVRCLPNTGDTSCCVIKDGDAVLVPCEVHGTKKPKRQIQYRKPFMNYALKHFVRWQRVGSFAARSALAIASFSAGLYVASKIPQSLVECCKNIVGMR